MKTLLSLLALLPIALFAQDIGWYNTQSSPYTISTADELKGLQSLVENNIQDFSGKTIKLGSNIALTGTWTPIGSDTRQFKGIFDGQGYTISGLSVNGGNYAGLFGYVGEDGQIKNLNVVATKIKTNLSTAGGLVAYYASTKPIENCGAKADSIISIGSVVNDGSGGGLVGYASAALTIANSFASGNVSVRATVGSTSSSFAYVYSGGLVGAGREGVTITNSYASGNISNISATDYKGGIFGYYSSGSNTSVYYNSAGADKAAGSGSPTGIMAMSAENLKKRNTFSNWDFNTIWGIDEGVNYPYLRAAGTSNISSSSAYPSSSSSIPISSSSINSSSSVLSSSAYQSSSSSILGSSSSSSSISSSSAPMQYWCLDIGNRMCSPLAGSCPSGTYPNDYCPPDYTIGSNSSSSSYQSSSSKGSSSSVSSSSAEPCRPTLTEIQNACPGTTSFYQNSGKWCVIDACYPLLSSSGSSSSSGNSESYEHCVFTQDRFCLSGSYKTCPAGGTLSHNCPFNAVPIRHPQTASGNIRVQTIANAIVLENLPTNAKVEVYNLQGKRIYSSIPENPQILRILVQTKGIYVVKTGSQIMRVAVR
jgi:hypothetical protein